MTYNGLSTLKDKPPFETEPQAGNLLSVEQTGFTSCNHYFGSNDALERKIFPDLKQYRKVHILAEGFQNKGNEIYSHTG